MSRCARCRGVWYCGPKCQRAAWGAHKSVCAAAVAVAAAAARDGGSCSGSGVPDAHAVGGGGSGGLDATLRDVAVAMLGSRRAAERVACLDTLASIYCKLGESNRKYYEFQMAVMEAGGRCSYA